MGGFADNFTKSWRRSVGQLNVDKVIFRVIEDGGCTGTNCSQNARALIGKIHVEMPVIRAFPQYERVDHTIERFCGQLVRFDPDQRFTFCGKVTQSASGFACDAGLKCDLMRLFFRRLDRILVR